MLQSGAILLSTYTVTVTTQLSDLNRVKEKAVLQVEGYYRVLNKVIHSLNSPDFFLHSNINLRSHKYDLSRELKLTRVRISFLNFAFQIYFFDTRLMRFFGEYG